MPSKNSVKEYVAGGYYHIYNRGVNKRIIFKDQKDYSTFISYLKLYLDPQVTITTDLQGLSLKVSPSRLPKNYNKEVKLLAYCLMPNHFHLLITQTDDGSMSHFMSSIITKYVRYFNTRYKRIGPLFQGRYKAVKVESEYQLTYLSKYIHRNPLDLKAFKSNKNKSLSTYKYSSYPNYIRLFNQSWLNTSPILALFSKTKSSNSYDKFVCETEVDDITVIEKILLDII